MPAFRACALKIRIDTSNKDFADRALLAAV